MLKQFMRKTAGIFTATAVIVAGLVSIPTTAFADEPQQQPLDPPTSATLTVDSVDTTNATLKATLDKPLEDSQSTLSLYKTGDPVTQQTATSGDEITFIVPRPTTTEYEQYYVTVGNLVSNSVTINNPSNQWEVSISTTKPIFQTDERNLSLDWEINQPVNAASQQALWIVNKTDNQTIWVANNFNDLTGNIPVAWFETGGKKEYIAYIAPYNDAISSPNQISGIITSSNSIFFERKPWDITLSTSTTEFSTTDPDPTITWETNQPVYSNYGGYAVFTVHKETGTVVNISASLTGSYSFSHRFTTGDTQTYEAYVAYYEAYKAYFTVEDLTDIQSKSNTISLSRTPWELTLSINQEEFTSDSPTPVITWETNQGLKLSNGNWGKYGVYFAETETGDIWTFFGGDAPLSTGSLEIPRFYNGAPREYIAYVAKWENYKNFTNISQLEDIQATSNTVYTERANWELTLDIDKTVFSTGEQPLITWQTNQSVGRTNNNYGVYLINTDTEEIVQAVGGWYGLENTGGFGVSDFYNGGPRKYKAYVAKWKNTYTHLEDLEDIQAISNTVQTSRASWEISITPSQTSFTTGDSAPTISWTTNQNVGSTMGKYAVYTVDETTGQIISSNFYYQLGTTGSAQIANFQYEDSHTYRAYVAKYEFNTNLYDVSQLEDIQAASNIVTISRVPWELSVGVDRVSYDSQGPSPIGTWSVNQPINNSGYALYLIDTQTNEIRDSWWFRVDELQSYFSPPTYNHGGPWTYKIVIAKLDTEALTADDLTHIQATSETFTIKRALWNVSLNTSIYGYVPGVYQAVMADFKTTQSVQHSGYYWVYVADAKTGTIYGSSYQGTYYSGASFLAPIEATQYVAYVAKYDPTLNFIYQRTYTNVSQLEDIQAVSTVSVINELEPGILAERYQGGGNPSEGNCNQQCYGDPVNSYNGEFFENETDLSISSAIPFDFSRSYSTNQNNTEGAFGAGWTFNYNMSLSGDATTLENSEKIKVFQENGAVTKFTKATSNGVEKFVAPLSTLADLEYDSTNDKYLFKRRNTTTYVFNAQTGKLEQIKDLNGNYLNLTYTNDKLTQIANNANKTLTISWSGNRISFVSDGTRTVAYSYSSAGNVEIVNFPDLTGNKQYIYNTNNLITGVVHPNGGAYHNIYDSDNKVIEQTDPLNGVTQFSYAPNQTTFITLPDGTVNRETYDILGQLSSKTMALGTTSEVSYSYSYDYTGQVNAEYGPTGLIASYTHDAYGNTLSVTNASNQTYRYTYNSLNQLVETQNPAGKTSHNIYDEKGNLIKSESYAGKVTEYEINPNGTNASVTSPNDVANQTGKKVLFGYDVLTATLTLLPSQKVVRSQW